MVSQSLSISQLMRSHWEYLHEILEVHAVSVKVHVHDKCLYAYSVISIGYPMYIHTANRMAFLFFFLYRVSLHPTVIETIVLS